MNNLINLKSNAIIDPQAQRIVDYLSELGLPAENIIADQSQREIVGENLSTLISKIPDEQKKDAVYLSKFVVGAGIGLFDYSLNAIWNEVVLKLRSKVVLYGIDIFFDAAIGSSKAREFYDSEEHLSSIKDSVLLDTCRKLELINDVTYKKLKHILEMRNDIGISHPNRYSINAYELLSYLQTCIQDVLSDNPTAAALQVQAFIANLKDRKIPLDATAQQGIESQIAQLPSNMCENLLRTIFGIYVSPETEPPVRKNISLIAPKLWDSCGDDVKFKLGILLEGYNINLYEIKHSLGIEFFEIVGGQSFRSPSERAIIVDRLLSELESKHNGWDNFHHEAPIAAEIYSYVPDQSSIIEHLAFKLFKIIMICRIGNGVSYQSGVSPVGKRYYDAILAMSGDKYAPHVMAALPHYEIKMRLNNERCLRHAVDALKIVRKYTINERISECLDYLINNLPHNRNCLSSKEFKTMSAHYIKWL